MSDTEALAESHIKLLEETYAELSSGVWGDKELDDYLDTIKNCLDDWRPVIEDAHTKWIYADNHRTRLLLLAHSMSSSIDKLTDARETAESVSESLRRIS